MEQLEGIIEQPIFRNGNGFIVFNLRVGRQVHRVAGEDVDLHESDVVECKGEWANFRGQPQFKAKSIIPQIPTSAEAITAYLASGRIKGISKVFAARLVDAFGLNVIEVVEKEPHRLKEVPGFGKSRIKILTEGLNEQIGYRSILLFLHGFGLGKHLIKKIHKIYGLSAVEKIKVNPYQLCQDVSGIGFNIADRIGLKMGIDVNHPDRLIAGSEYALLAQVNQTGSTGVPESKLVEKAVELLSREEPVSPEKVKEGVNQLIKRRLAQRFSVSGEEYIFPIALFTAEQGIARHLKRLLGVTCKVAPDTGAMDELIDDVQKDFGIKLGDQQREAVKMALANAVSIITGGPGTGKTTIMRVYLECCRRILNMKNTEILLCAPTGKAAKRLSSTTGLEALTIHRALEYQPIDGEFFYNEENPLEASLIVVDEFSMTGADVAYWLLQAVETGARLVIVGDVDQLASVSPGKVLMDMLESGEIPFTRLTDIFRQAAESQIIVNCHKIRKGEMPDINNKSKDNDFWFLHSNNDSETAKIIISLIDRLSRHYGYDPFDDIQVLSPMRKGELGQYALNHEIQKLLNGAELGNGIRLRQDDVEVELCRGDKVMHIKNNRDLDVNNGDTGRITQVKLKERMVLVQYDHAIVEYAYADLEELRLAYVMTIHKSQGSEYPCLILPATMAHYNLLERNTWYTGFSRAQKTLAVAGDQKALRVAASRVSTDKRLTGLMEHLKRAS